MPAESPKALYQAVATDITALIQRRALDAVPIRALSRRDGKKVEAVEEPNGNQFVRRAYEQPFHRLPGGLSFEEAWNGMMEMFSKAGLPVVPSYIVKATRDGEGTVIISEYLPDTELVYDAPLEEKLKLAEGLGNLLHRSTRFMPSSQMLMVSLVQLAERVPGKPEILVTDVDPYVEQISGSGLGVLNNFPAVKDIYFGHYINRVGDLFWNVWCKEEERETVLRQFTEAVAPAIELLGGRDTRTLKAFGEVRLMSQGVNLRDW